MIIHKPWLCTKLSIWHPKYSEKHANVEPVVLLSKAKVHHSSSIIIIEFTKARSLLGQRFCITRDVAQRCEVVTNGKIPCYSVPMSLLEPWQSSQEVRDLSFALFKD